MSYADVILPLAIPAYYTYAVPEGMSVEPGSRVAVPLGRSQLYTGIVRRVHDVPPTKYKVKPIRELIDARPVVLEEHMAFWEWIAQYYLCNPGEVMNAALPGGLRLSEDIRITRNTEVTVDDSMDMPAGAWTILDMLDTRKEVALKDIERALEKQEVRSDVHYLLDQGFISTTEELKGLYKPVQEPYITFGKDYRSDTALEQLFAAMEQDARSEKQVHVMMAFLKHAGTNYQIEIEKKTLMAEDISASSLNTLVKKEVLEIVHKEVSRFGMYDAELKDAGVLSDEQEAVLQDIRRAFEDEKVTLLHGVTGSGKTEIYVHLIEEMLQQGKQVLYLLPEIALTAQLIGRLQKYFGDQVGVYHSRFSTNERSEVWKEVMKPDGGRFRLIVGARSSMFLPFRDLGLIIIDEEHENTFKQQDPAPRYHARDASVVLANRVGARVLMGSATPSIESYWNAHHGKYHLVELHKRYGGVQLPEVQIIDMRREAKRKRLKQGFSITLIEAMEHTIAAGRQVILFQNRRGFAPFLQCEVCGHVPECHQCDVSLTYHKKINLLKCHYCGHSERPPKLCNACGSTRVKMVGFGTERIEEELALLLPEVTISRLDLETARSRTHYERVIEEFAAGQVDVLIGTQMISKGLDFEKVGLVGILSADQILRFPDFRSHERAFQLMSQVAGRAGRKGKRGKVLIQAFHPDNYVIEHVIRHDFVGMYHQEVLERRNFHYPPFVRMIGFTLRHRDRTLTEEAAKHLVRELKKVPTVTVLGPEYPLVGRVMNQYIQQVMVKIPANAKMLDIKRRCTDIVTNLQVHDSFKRVRVNVDVDPN